MVREEIPVLDNAIDVRARSVRGTEIERPFKGLLSVEGRSLALRVGRPSD